jgi:hypothetical protein
MVGGGGSGETHGANRLKLGTHSLPDLQLLVVVSYEATLFQHARSRLHPACGTTALALRDYGLADPSNPMHTVARHILMQQLDGELARAYSFDQPDLSFHCIA